MGPGAEAACRPPPSGLCSWWPRATAPGSAGLGTVLGEVGLSLQSLEPAERRGLVRTADGGVRLCHPLLRSVVLDRTPLADRVQVYQALARASDGSLRAWYLAAAATGPDEAAAGALVVAAEDARRRSGYGASARAWRRAAELSTTTVCPRHPTAERG